MLVHPPADVHGGRGLGPGAGPLRQRRGRHARHQLGLRSPPASPSGSPPSARLGSLHSDGTTLTYDLRSGGAETFDFEPSTPFAAEIGHFADSLLDGTRPIHTELEGIQVLGMILAAYESARSGRFVDIAELEPVAAR